jgi:hypothetical protein
MGHTPNVGVSRPLPVSSLWQGWPWAGTRLTFTHVGLTPQLPCCELCEPGWSRYLESLRHQVERGAGTPIRRADAAPGAA